MAQLPLSPSQPTPHIEFREQVFTLPAWKALPLAQATSSRALSFDALLARWNLRQPDVVWAEQVHGARVAMVASAHRGQEHPHCDALVTQEAGLPLPLGGNVIRKDFGSEMMSKISRHIHASIAYALEHRASALDHAMRFARGLDRNKADEFVGMYVNDWTLDYGPRGREAIRLFLDRAWKAGLIPNQVTVEFVSE